MIRHSWIALSLASALACGPERSASAPSTSIPLTESSSGPQADSPLPSDSVYHLRPALTNQDGQRVELGLYRGAPVVISMFYATCPTACPMLINDVKALEASLSAEDRAQLRVLLVSLDPADTPEALAEVVVRHDLDMARWTLVRTDERAVRDIAAALGISYRATGDGQMNHSALLTLLDVNGRPVSRLEGLQRDAAPLREALEQAKSGS